MDTARLGIQNATPVIDFHTHIVPPDVIARRQEYLARDAWFGKLYENPKAELATAEMLIASMDRAGIDASVVFGFSWADDGLLRTNNDYVLDAMSRHPDRLIGFACINPLDGGAATREIERCAARGIRGLGELMPDGQGYALDDIDLLTPIVQAARHHRLILLTHTSEPLGHTYPGKGHTTPDQIVRFAQHFPDVKLVCAHWGGGLPFYELMPELMLVLRNVYYDTAAGHYLYRDKILDLAMGLMPHKILWATDFPLITQQYSLNRLRWSHLPPSLNNKLLGENARQLLNVA
jgi:predicted TIM-barrel fold metal-dependent hydrolase